MMKTFNITNDSHPNDTYLQLHVNGSLDPPEGFHQMPVLLEVGGEGLGVRTQVCQFSLQRQIKNSISHKKKVNKIST